MWHKRTFSYRIPVEINCDYVDQDISNFVVSFKLEGSHHLFSNTRSDGYDIVVTDVSGNDLPFERSRWSQNDEILVLYIKLDLKSSYNTKFYIYYGDSSQTSDPQDSDSTWSAYSLVLHFEESSGDALDSSPHGRDAYVSSNVNRNHDGTFGNSFRFNGSSTSYARSYYVIDDVTSEWTISANVAPLTDSDSRIGIAGNAWNYHDWYIGLASNSRFTCWVCHPSSCGYATDSDSYSTNTFYYVIGTYASSQLELFVDGYLKATQNFSWSRAVYSEFFVARTFGGEYFNGLIDEVRVANFKYSDARAKAEGINFKAFSDFVLIRDYEEPYLLDNAPTIFSVGKVEDESFKSLSVEFEVGEPKERFLDLETKNFFSSVSNLISGTINLPDEFVVSWSGGLTGSYFDLDDNFFSGKIVASDVFDLVDDFTIGKISVSELDGVDVYNEFIAGHIVSPSGLGEDIHVEYIRPLSFETNLDEYVDFTISTSKLFEYISDIFSSSLTTSGIDTDAHVRGGLITWFDSDVYVSLTDLISLTTDSYSSLLDINYYPSDVVTRSGGISRVVSDVLSSRQQFQGLLSDIRLLGLKIDNFFLDVEEFKPASTVMSVDLLDFVSLVDISKSYFVISGTTVSSTFSPIPNGYRMFYDSPTDFYSEDPIEVVVHLENIIGDVLEQRYYLLYGYNLIYSTVDPWDWGKDIAVWARAYNLGQCKEVATDAWYFTVVDKPSSDLGAKIFPDVRTSDLKATIYPQSKGFYYGKSFEFTIYAKDKAGNDMIPFKLKFKIRHD